MPAFQIRLLKPSDCEWVRRFIITDWGAEIVVVHNEVFLPADLPGFAAFSDEKPVGLITYNITRNGCEIITLNSWREEQGVGTALLLAVRQVAGQDGCGRLFLITTNNNLHALRFYQKRGFVISAIHLNAITESRKLKPQIPLLDEDGLPIRDEIELEYSL